MDWKSMILGAAIAGPFGAFLGFLGSIIANAYTPRALYWYENLNKIRNNILHHLQLKKEPVFDQKSNIYSSICSHAVSEFNFSEIVNKYLSSKMKNKIEEALITNIQEPKWYFDNLNKDPQFNTYFQELKNLTSSSAYNFSEIKICLDKIRKEFYLSESSTFPHQKSIYFTQLSTIRFNFYPISFDCENIPIVEDNLKKFKESNPLETILVFEKIFGNNSFENGNKIKNLIISPFHPRIKESFPCIKGTDSIVFIKSNKSEDPTTKEKLVLYYDDEIYMLNYQTIGKTASLNDGFFQRLVKFKNHLGEIEFLEHDFKHILLAYDLTKEQINKLMKNNNYKLK